jgi:SPP1 gp7 family putative phage head morphogenesis protein
VEQMADYWGERIAKAQQKITDTNIAKTQKQLIKYYQRAAARCIEDFENTYSKMLAAVESGREPTPADLYKLDKYWQSQGQLRAELLKLGNKEIELMGQMFETNFFEVYYSLNLPDATAAYNTVSQEMAQQMINQIWCADGKSWSARVWQNTEELLETLNEELIHCVTTGKRTTELKNILQSRFNVSYNRADALVRTELAHIQTMAAQKRYEDYGIQQVELLVDEDERTCPECAKMEGKRYLITDRMPVPIHPKCRCCMIPVIGNIEKPKENEPEPTETKNKFGQTIDFNKRFDSEDWAEPISIIKKLSSEYDTRLSSVKIGSVKTAGSVDMGGNMYLSSKKPETAIHEFAHSLTMKDLTKFGVENQEEFWKEIERIKRAYRKDAGDNPFKWISSYEHSTNKTDEFLAEAFTQAKASELGIKLPDSYGKEDKYSKEVLAVIDKYFKKKKK